MGKHSVFTDPEPSIPPGVTIPKETRQERCVGNRCLQYDCGAPHVCPTGRCQHYENRVIKLVEAKTTGDPA